MAVHNLVAENLVVTKKWEPIDTMPKDGTVVELKYSDGTVARAIWRSGDQLIADKLPVDKTARPDGWRLVD